MTRPLEQESAALPALDALAFAPLHKRHFGTAIGTAAGLTVAIFTILDLLTNPPGAHPLTLLEQYFTGYSVSWSGLLIGAMWGFFVGWVGGWFVAFVRNLTLATAIFWVRTKANLQASRDFLDHI